MGFGCLNDTCWCFMGYSVWCGVGVLVVLIVFVGFYFITNVCVSVCFEASNL